MCVCVEVRSTQTDLLANFFEGIQTNCLRFTHEPPLDFIMDEL